jgi:deoxycytidine triphosphate deaminase
MIHIKGSAKSIFKGLEGDTKAIQPNAFDFRVENVFMFTDCCFELCNDDSKTHRTRVELEPDASGFWILGVGSYGILTNIDCEIAEGEAGWLIPRSSLNRNGVFLTSGLYDSGFHNKVGCTLHVTPGCVFRVQKGSRIGQFILVRAETTGMYNGSYNAPTP